MNPYPLWKTLTLVFFLVFGALYSAPNFFGEDAALQVSPIKGEGFPDDLAGKISQALAAKGLKAKASGVENGQWLVRFDGADTQIKAADALKVALSDTYLVALTSASKTPQWLRNLGAKPMALGLDLRGGVHFLIEVDTVDAEKAAVQRYLTDLPAFLRKENLRYTGRKSEVRKIDDKNKTVIVLDFAEASVAEAARKALAKENPELQISQKATQVEAFMTDVELKRIVDQAIEQNLVTLRNRVNQLGVAEPLVQRQGANRIVVQLPGVQDATRAEDLLGATATLEYRAVVEDMGALSSAVAGNVPSDMDLFYTRDGNRPVLVSRDIIASGTQLVDAAATFDQDGQPAVSVTLDSKGAKDMFEFTRANVGKPMAVLFKETRISSKAGADGSVVREKKEINEIISVASVREPFGKRFQTSGLEQTEAHNLALLLKAGALAAPIEIVEQRTVGPSLGADNIRQGMSAAVLGLVLVIVFMGVYYKVFGLFAGAALLMNLLLLVAVLSLMQATLTMPGIAGIVLHMGIAVDANVLIYERIREELRGGMKPHQAIEAGYDRAFLTIADANVTVLIGTLTLFALGAGAVKGFAITLSIGIITSQFTAIVGSRALAHAVFGRKARLNDLPIW
jgi:preprotein translocase subunit SecD